MVALLACDLCHGRIFGSACSMRAATSGPLEVDVRDGRYSSLGIDLGSREREEKFTGDLVTSKDLLRACCH